MTNLRTLLSAVGVLAVSGCAAGLPAGYGELYGTRYRLAPIDTHAVLVVRVDGKDTVGSPVFVDPGVRQVTVQGPAGGARRIGEERTIDLNVAPCTRYYLVAKKPNRLAVDFTVEIDHQEPIGGCQPPGA